MARTRGHVQRRLGRDFEADGGGNVNYTEHTPARARVTSCLNPALDVARGWGHVQIPGGYSNGGGVINTPRSRRISRMLRRERFLDQRG